MRDRLTAEQRELVARLARRSMLSYRQIAQRFGISEALVSQIAVESGYHRSRPWSDSDIAFLKENYQKRGARGCATVLGRNYQVVSRKARQLGLSTDVGPYGKLRVIDGGHTDVEV